MSEINFSLASQSYKVIQEIQDQCTRAEKGEKVDLKQTVEKLDGLVKQLNKDRAAINAGAKITREVREAYDLQKSNLTSLNARVKALSAKANIAPAWVKPVAYTALTLGLIAFSAFIVQKTGVLASPSTPMTSNPPAPSSPTVQTPTPLGNTPLPFCDYLDSKGVSNSTNLNFKFDPIQTRGYVRDFDADFSSKISLDSQGLGTDYLTSIAAVLGAGVIAGAVKLYQQFRSLHSMYVDRRFAVYLENANVAWRADMEAEGPALSATVYQDQGVDPLMHVIQDVSYCYRSVSGVYRLGATDPEHFYWKCLRPETQENIQKIVLELYKKEMWKSMLSFETLAPVGRRAVIVAVATAGLLAVGNLLYRTYYSEDDPTAAAQTGALTAQS